MPQNPRTPVCVGHALGGNDYVDVEFFAVYVLDSDGRFTDVLFVSLNEDDCDAWVAARSDTHAPATPAPLDQQELR